MQLEYCSLVDEFRTRVRDNPHLWVECAGDRFSQSTPFHAVTEILNQGLGWRGHESLKQRIAQLERNLELAGLKLGEAVPLIAEMLGLPIPDKYPALVFAPDQRRRRLLANLTAWVLNAARAQPLVLVVEDLHWIDPSTLELAHTLVDQAVTAPLMLLYTTRPEFKAPWPLRAHHARITLSRLNDRDTREMVVGVVARAALARDLIPTTWWLTGQCESQNMSASGRSLSAFCPILISNRLPPLSGGAVIDPLSTTLVVALTWGGFTACRSLGSATAIGLPAETIRAR